MHNYRNIIRQAQKENGSTAKRVASIPAKKYNRSRAQAKQYNITETTSSSHMSGSSSAWDVAQDAELSYEEMEAQFWG